jgi:hypothetical protein
VPSEVLLDDQRRGKKLSNELMSYWASQIDISQPKVEIVDDPAEDGLAADRDVTPCTVSDEPLLDGEEIAPRLSDVEANAEASEAPNRNTTPCTVSAAPEDGRDCTSLLSTQRGERPEGAEGGEPQSRSLTRTASGDDAESEIDDTNLPLPLAERRADASETLRALSRGAPADDPADSWEAEVLGMAVKSGLASASIVARFVEEASSVPIFPEPGTANRARPPMHHYLERLSPRGWPRVTATGSSSISLMGLP